MRELNYWSKSRMIFLKGIDDNEFIPTEYKKELKELCAREFQIMAQWVGTFELLFHREEAHYKGLYEKLNNPELLNQK